MSGPGRPRAGLGALAFVAILFAGSAATRLGLQAGQAVASESPGMAAPERTEPEECTTPRDIQTAIDLLRQREEQIATREANLADRTQALAVADREISARLSELEAAEADLRKLLSVAEEAAEGDLSRLTSVYEAMKPKDAAALFEEMEPEFAAGFLGRMRPDAAAGILTGLSPETAHMISVVLAGRNARALKE